MTRENDKWLSCNVGDWRGVQWTPVLKTHPVIAIAHHFGVCKTACIAQCAGTCKRRQQWVRYSLRSELGCKGKMRLRVGVAE